LLEKTSKVDPPSQNNLKSEEEAGADADRGIAPNYWSVEQRSISSGHFFLVAEYMSLSGDHGRAKPLLQAAYNLDPNPFLGAKLLESSIAAGPNEDTLMDAKRMVLLYPRASSLRLQLARLYVKSGYVSDAIEQYTAGYDLDPNREELAVEFVSVLHRAGKGELARVTCEKFLKQNPDSIPMAVAHTKILVSQGEKTKALAAAKFAYELQTSNPELVLIYALALELNGKSQEAVAQYEQLYRMDPSNEELTSRMIELYRQLGDLNVALELLDELSKVPGGDKPGIQMQKAILLWELERYEDASKLLDRLAVDFPQSERLQYMAALGREKIKKFESAIYLYLNVPEKSALRAQADFRRAICFKALDKSKEALKLMHELLQAPGAEWAYFAFTAELYSDLERFDESIRILREADAKFSESAKTLFLIGVYQERGGKKDDCIETMKRVIELEPENSSALNFLGYLYAEKGLNLEEAEKLIGRALQIKGEDGYYLDSLGWVYYQQGRLDLAEKTLNRANEKSPNEGVILEHLAEVKFKRGDKSSAKDLFKSALNTKLDVRDRERISKRYRVLFGAE